MAKARLPRVASRQKLKLFENANGRIQIEHDGPASGEGAYDWSCLVLSPTEAAWLGRKLVAWATPEGQLDG